MALYLMASRALVRIAGEDAKKLCNDTLTCRFEGLGAGIGRWFALLTPQGKVLAEGLVTLEDGVYWFDLPAAVAPDFIKRMKMYRLRAKAEIDAVDDRVIVWSPDEELPPRGTPIPYRDERGEAMGTRLIVARDDVPEGTPEVGEDYELARIGTGLMEIGADFTANEMFPHDLGMDFLHGLDFKKGCYIGQEVVSRMQHRGTARRRPVIVSGLPDGAAPGAPLLVGEREIGTIGTMRNGHALALVRLDRVTDPGGVTFAGLPVELKLPSWAPYQFGEAPAED